MKKMKCSKKHTLGDVEFFDVTITEKNLLPISEKIALRALKTARAYSCGKLDKLFNCLRYDIYHPHNDPDHIFSDGYDIVQSVAMFLCPHIGKTLASPLCKDKYGNEISLGKAGFRCADRYILKHFRTENSYIARLDQGRGYNAPNAAHKRRKASARLLSCRNDLLQYSAQFGR